MLIDNLFIQKLQKREAADKPEIAEAQETQDTPKNDTPPGLKTKGKCEHCDNCGKCGKSEQKGQKLGIIS